MKKLLFLSLALLTIFYPLFAQDKPKTILWKISGKGITNPSYLLGTNHSFNDTWIDSFTVIKKLLFQSDVIVTELPAHNQRQIDGSKVDTNHIPFDKLFSQEEYSLVNAYLKSRKLSTLEKAPNNFFSVLGLFHATYVRLMQPGEKENSDAIDIYIEKVGKEKMNIQYLDAGIVGLKTDSVAGLNEKVLAGLIIWAINNEANTKAISALTDAVKPSFDEFSHLTVDYKLNENLPNPTEQANRELLLKRNEAWLAKLPALLKSNACFIAVGLTHLKFKEGLISRLRAMGFRVTPVPIERL